MNSSERKRQKNKTTTASSEPCLRFYLWKVPQMAGKGYTGMGVDNPITGQNNGLVGEVP